MTSPDTLAQTIREAKHASACLADYAEESQPTAEVDYQRAIIVAALDSLLALVAERERERDCEKRESGEQMAAKLEAQQALLAITRALDMTLLEMGNGWTEGVMHILARVEVIVDEANRLGAERDAAVREAATLREALQELTTVHNGSSARVIANRALAAAAPAETAR